REGHPPVFIESESHARCASVSIGSEPGVNATGDELLRLNHRGKTRRRNSVLDRLSQTMAAQDGPHRLPPVIGGPQRNGERLDIGLRTCGRITVELEADRPAQSPARLRNKRV